MMTSEHEEQWCVLVVAKTPHGTYRGRVNFRDSIGKQETIEAKIKIFELHLKKESFVIPVELSVGSLVTLGKELVSNSSVQFLSGLYQEFHDERIWPENLQGFTKDT